MLYLDPVMNTLYGSMHSSTLHQSSSFLLSAWFVVVVCPPSVWAFSLSLPIDWKVCKACRELQLSKKKRYTSNPPPIYQHRVCRWQQHSRSISPKTPCWACGISPRPTASGHACIRWRFWHLQGGVWDRQSISLTGHPWVSATPPHRVQPGHEPPATGRQRPSSE